MVRTGEVAVTLLSLITFSPGTEAISRATPRVAALDSSGEALRPFPLALAFGHWRERGRGFLQVSFAFIFARRVAPSTMAAAIIVPGMFGTCGIRLMSFINLF